MSIVCERVWQLCGFQFYKIHVSIDTTVETLYGYQQGGCHAPSPAKLITKIVMTRLRMQQKNGGTKLVTAIYVQISGNTPGLSPISIKILG